MQNHKIPVFYHIPKNAGTYVSDWMLVAFRYYREFYTNWLKSYTSDKDSIKVIQITNNDSIVARILLGDPNYILDSKKAELFKKHNNRRWDVDINYVSFDFLKELVLFGVIIESNGFKIKQKLLYFLKEYNLHQFLILRNPFHRIQSIYNYNTSNQSINDYSHGSIKSKTFEDYVTSEQLEDSWLIRNLINLNDPEILEEHHFQQSLEILKSFNVYDIKDTDKAIQQTFQECYGFDTQKIELKSWDIITKNETNYKKINIEELSKEAQEVFKQRTFWDQKLYKQFFK